MLFCVGETKCEKKCKSLFMYEHITLTLLFHWYMTILEIL